LAVTTERSEAVMIDWTGLFIGVIVGGFAGLLLEAYLNDCE